MCTDHSVSLRVLFKCLPRSPQHLPALPSQQAGAGAPPRGAPGPGTRGPAGRPLPSTFTFTFTLDVRCSPRYHTCYFIFHSCSCVLQLLSHFALRTSTSTLRLRIYARMHNMSVSVTFNIVIGEEREEAGALDLSTEHGTSHMALTYPPPCDPP
eukprot:scaffold5808_cov128-Isochrysis_galbana.AAC.16